jgi:hypothetical protein
MVHVLHGFSGFDVGSVCISHAKAMLYDCIRIVHRPRDIFLPKSGTSRMDAWYLFGS